MTRGPRRRPVDQRGWRSPRPKRSSRPKWRPAEVGYRGKDVHVRLREIGSHPRLEHGRRRRTCGRARGTCGARRRDAARRPAVALGGPRPRSRTSSGSSIYIAESRHRSRPTSACREPARTWCSDVSRLAEEIRDQKLRHRSRTARRAPCASDIEPIVDIVQATGDGDRRRPVSSARARCGSTPRTGSSTGCSAWSRTAVGVRHRRGPAGHVRHRGHDPGQSRGPASALHDRGRCGCTARLRGGYDRARDPEWGEERDPVHSQRRRRDRRGGQGRLARPPGPRPRGDQRAHRGRCRRRSAARYRARHRRTGRQHADRSPARQTCSFSAGSTATCRV